jgi:hypothetical protein
VKQDASSISLIWKHGFELVFLLTLSVLEELVFSDCSLQAEIFNEDVSYNETFSFHRHALLCRNFESSNTIPSKPIQEHSNLTDMCRNRRRYFIINTENG